MSSVNHSADELHEFLTFLYESTDGYVYAPTLDRTNLDENGRPTWSKHFFKWPNQSDDLYCHIVTETPNKDVYVAPALFNEPNPHKEYVKGSHVLWVDLDNGMPSESQIEGIPEPSYRLKTSSDDRQHWYWKLDSFQTDRMQVENANRNLMYSLGADASGWDCNQVLRPVQTINQKYGTSVNLLYHNANTISFTNFASVPVAPQLTVHLEANDLVDTAPVIAKYEWPREIFDLYRTREIPEGDRSTALMRLAYSGAELGMSDREIFSILYSADERWGKFRNRPDRLQRLSDMVARAKQKHPVGPLVTFKPTDILPAFGFQTFLNTEVTIEWIIPGVLQKLGYMMVTGPSGVGKTQWSLRFAIALALGKNFCGYEVKDPVKVVFFSMEMGHADLKYFLSEMAKTLHADDFNLLERNLILIPHGEPLYMDSPEGVKLFEEVMDTHKPDGFFFDSLGSASSGELNQENTAKVLMDWNDRARKKYQVFSWFIHHMRKANATNSKPNKQDDVYGNQYIFNRATSVYCLWPDRKNRNLIEVICLKKRLGPKEEPQAIERIANIDFRQTTLIVTDEPDPIVLTYEQPKPIVRPSKEELPPLPPKDRPPGVFDI